MITDGRLSVETVAAVVVDVAVFFNSEEVEVVVVGGCDGAVCEVGVGVVLSDADWGRG